MKEWKIFDYIKRHKIIVIITILAFLFGSVWDRCSDVISFHEKKKKEDFFKKDQSYFKVLILPFNEVYEKDNADVGWTIRNRLKDKINDENLKLEVYYHDYSISKNFDSDSASYLLNKHEADLLIFGHFKSQACKAGQEEYCINYVTTDKIPLGDLQNEISYSKYMPASLKQIEEGYLQMNIDFIIYWIDGLYYYDKEDYHKALKRFNFISENLNSMSLTLANKIGYSYQMINEEEKALAYNQVGLARSRYEENYGMEATFSNNIAVYYYRKNELDSALKYIDLAIGIRKDIFDSTSTNLGICYDNRGELLFKKGNINHAIECSKKAISIFEMSKNNNYELYIAKDKLSQYYLADSNYLKAINILHSARKSFIKSGNKDHAILAGIFSRIAYVYFLMGNYGKSIENTKFALTYQDLIDTNLIINIYSLQSENYFKLGLFLNEIESYHKAIDIYEKFDDKKEDQLANMYSHYSRVLHDNLQDSLAIYYLKKAISINLEDSNRNNLGKNYKILGDIYFDKLSFDKSLSCYMQSYNILNSSISPDKYEISLIVVRLGNIYNNKGNYDIAINKYKEGLRMFEFIDERKHATIS
ncbi:MAG: tetratricopeptide repeat protein [Bacteroidales bacterium]